ncbi:hypothetical protein ACIU1J_30095 [Azospirillum doebereinerae]|uniref:hypothetical protein n=1 Tax=Azospirillum doebereinerae TaxID=92933 RepID=UPI001EE51A15|nr:hypothetical protein [Azospirillum doebereinerae]MCG5240942.1 hypothetical protein [Azospirillum doebereinerae]
MKILSLLEDTKRAPNDYTIPQRGLKSSIEADFSMAGVFLTYSKPSQELLAWLENVAFDAFAVNFIKGGRAVISVMSRHDAYAVQGAFVNEFEICVVMSAKPAVWDVEDLEQRERRS